MTDQIPASVPLPTLRSLLRSTLVALLIAGALLVTVVLPAEYGVDPTGIGRVIGLTPMGEIKMRLAREAAEDAAADAAALEAAEVEAAAAQRDTINGVPPIDTSTPPQ